MDARWSACAAVLAALGGCGPDFASPPRTRAGLWVTTVILNGRPRPPAPFCDPGHAVLPRADPACSQWRPTQIQSGVMLDAICARLGGTMRLHRRIVGDFTRAYTDDVSVFGAAPNEPPTTVSVHFDYRYQGVCPPGMKTFNPAAG